MKLYYRPDELDQCKADAKEHSETYRCVVQISHALDHREQPCYVISDWYDRHNCVARYSNGRSLT